jgi:hypothetical protein
MRLIAWDCSAFTRRAHAREILEFLMTTRRAIFSNRARARRV